MGEGGVTAIPHFMPHLGVWGVVSFSVFSADLVFSLKGKQNELPYGHSTHAWYPVATDWIVVPNRATSSGPVTNGVGLITRGRLTVNMCRVFEFR